jgi:hypothetical protein
MFGPPAGHGLELMIDVDRAQPRRGERVQGVQ